MSSHSKTIAEVDRFQDEQGKFWICIRDGAKRHNIPVANLHLWVKRVCSWTGKKLGCRPNPKPGGSRYVLESELREISEAIARGHKHRHSLSARNALPFPDALPFHEIRKRDRRAKPALLLYAHKHPDRCPEGKGIWADRLPGYDQNGKWRLRLWHARWSEVEALLQRSPNGTHIADQPYADAMGNVWIPTTLARQLYGVGKQTLVTARKQPHSALGRTIRFLEPKEVPASLRGNRQVHYHLKDDCRLIGEWQNRLPALKRAKQFLRRILADGPVEYTTIEARARDADLSTRTLGAAKQSLGIKTTRVAFAGGPIYWHRSHQRVPVAPPVSPPHPKLDRAEQFLWSIPNFDAMPLPELASRAAQAGIARTTLGGAIRNLRDGGSREQPPAMPSPSLVEGTDDPAQTRQRGRRPSVFNRDLHRFCFAARMHGFKRKRVMAMTNGYFGRKVIKQDKHVTTFARRHAADAKVTFDPPAEVRQELFTFIPEDPTQKPFSYSPTTGGHRIGPGGATE
jgi:hypothetical protein